MFFSSGQSLESGCVFPTQFEQAWFYQYSGDGTEIMYEELIASAVNRRLYKTSSDKPEIGTHPPTHNI